MKGSLTFEKIVAVATKSLLLLLLLWSCWLLARIVFSYIPFNESVGFLIVKRRWLEHDWWRLLNFGISFAIANTGDYTVGLVMSMSSPFWQWLCPQGLYWH